MNSTTLQDILDKHAEIVPVMEKVKTYSVEVYNLHVKFIQEELAKAGANTFKRTLVSVLDPAATPRTTEATLEALRQQWPEAKLDAVQDNLTNKFYVFAT